MPIVCCSGVNYYICIRITYCFTSKPKIMKKFPPDVVLELVVNRLHEMYDYLPSVVDSSTSMYYEGRKQVLEDVFRTIEFFSEYEYDE